MSEVPLSQLLRDEYLHLQKTIEDFDAKALTIKTWSVSFGFAAIAGAFASKQSTVFLVAAGAALAFWLTEILWKGFQRAYYVRIAEIEQYFLTYKPKEENTANNITPLQITCSWKKTWEKQISTIDFFKIFIEPILWPAVFLPHVVVIVIGVYLYNMVKFS
jgi:hypothetical protein